MKTKLKYEFVYQSFFKSLKNQTSSFKLSKNLLLPHFQKIIEIALKVEKFSRIPFYAENQVIFLIFYAPAFKMLYFAKTYIHLFAP